MDILSIVVSNAIPTQFPDDVLTEADHVPDEISEKDLIGRKDLRDQLIVTIDGEDAKDLDDAVTVKNGQMAIIFLVSILQMCRIM